MNLIMLWIMFVLNLNYPSFSYKYFYNMYSYIAKSYIVCNWKEQRNPDQVVSVKFGEAICNDQLVNFFENEEHKHCSCSSVYYKFNQLININYLINFRKKKWGKQQSKCVFVFWIEQFDLSTLASYYHIGFLTKILKLMIMLMILSLLMNILF